MSMIVKGGLLYMFIDFFINLIYTIVVILEPLPHNHEMGPRAKPIRKGKETYSYVKWEAPRS
jgi:hypothetical protein